MLKIPICDYNNDRTYLFPHQIKVLSKRVLLITAVGRDIEVGSTEMKMSPLRCKLFFGLCISFPLACCCVSRRTKGTLSFLLMPDYFLHFNGQEGKR